MATTTVTNKSVRVVNLGLRIKPNDDADGRVAGVRQGAYLFAFSAAALSGNFSFRLIANGNGERCLYVDNNWPEQDLVQKVSGSVNSSWTRGPR